MSFSSEGSDSENRRERTITSSSGPQPPKETRTPGDQVGTVAPNKSKNDSSESSIDLAGFRGYFWFEEQIEALDSQLCDLANKARTLGSSVGILSASSRLRSRIGRVLFLFRKNANGLFPQHIRADHIKVALAADRKFNDWQRHATDDYPLDPNHFADEIRAFAEDISILLRCFTQFPAFVDEVPKDPLADDLKRWAKFLEKFQGELETVDAQRFLHDSMIDIGNKIVKSMSTKFIPVFIRVGIPTINSSQRHDMSTLTNQSTVAIFFSGVAATMLQNSWESVDTPCNVAINTFWFISLVLSASAAVNSLLGLSWTQAIYRSPDQTVPWWVKIWMMKSPLILLVLSVTCFFIGLVLFSYSSNQAKVTQAITTALVAICCFGLAVLSSWFIGEQWVYDKYDGLRWLSEIVDRTCKGVKEKLSLESRLPWCKGIDPTPSQGITGDVDPETTSFSLLGLRADTLQDAQQVSFWLSCDKDTMSPREIAQHRWREALLRVRQKVEERRDRADFYNLSGIIRRQKKTHELSLKTKKLHNPTIVPGLTENLHATLIRSLDFSPNGKQLITSSLDGKAFVLQVDPDNAKPILDLKDGCLGLGTMRHIKWSPGGSRVLICNSGSITLLDLNSKEGENAFTPLPIDIPKTRVAVWYGDKAFLSLEGNDIVERSLPGLTSTFSLQDHGSIQLRDIAVTKDLRWLICIGSYSGSDNDDGSRSLGNQIMLYSMQTKKVVKKAPVFHEMCTVTLTCDDSSALVNFVDRAPPQLWEFHIAKDQALRMLLRHTFIPLKPTAFSMIPSIFGGSDDELVLRAGTVGDINIWDRRTAAFLRTVTIVPELNGHLTALSWNRASKKWMLAAGVHSGQVYLWTEQDEDSINGDKMLAPEYQRSDSPLGMSALDSSTTLVTPGKRRPSQLRPSSYSSNSSGFPPPL